MNCVYFACDDCKVLVDAGYRWASGLLEDSGFVSRTSPVAVHIVRSATEYWSAGAPWLRDEVLPGVRAFLSKHEGHRLRYGDEEEIEGTGEYAFLDWLEVGYDATASPRYFTEILGLRTWQEVIDWTMHQPFPPWWWSLEETRDAARVRFTELTQEPAG
jgi:hypothetical protein